MFSKILNICFIILLEKSSFCSSQNTNLSQGKTASQSSTFSTFFANLAVDGNNGGTCSQTVSGATMSWWKVDLGDIYSVSYVNIYTSSGDSLVGVEVHVTTEEFSVRSSSNKCGTTISSTATHMVLGCSLSISGRYVIFSQSTTSQSLILCEVQVFGVTVPLCSMSQCFNGGTCYGSAASYVCSCPDTYTGLHCEITDIQGPTVSCPGNIIEFITTSQATVTWNDPLVIDNIDTDLPAVCFPPSGSTFTVISGVITVTCTATDNAGNQGMCQFIVAVFFPACTNSSCMNGGICHNSGDSYTCACPSSYSGTHCETLVSVCNSSPCMNGGTCQSSGNSYTCACPSSYSGTHCETLIVPACNSSPCMNGGICQNSGASYTCACQRSYTGIHCEILDVGNPSVLCSDVAMRTNTDEATVTWDDPSVIDNVDSDLSAVCSPSSGSSFPVGSTDVTCTAMDNAGNEGSCTFTVTVHVTEETSVDACSIPSYLIVVFVIVCLALIVMSPGFIFFCRFYYSQKNKKMQSTTRMNMTDYDEVNVRTNVRPTEYEINLPNVSVTTLDSNTRVNSGYEDLHTYMPVDHPYTDIKQ